jgi:HlyD family secretion protein
MRARAITQTGWGLVLVAALFMSAGCSREPKEVEPTVAVQAATAKKMPLNHTITAEAILYPLQQAAITAKISAPVKAFYVKRGAKVHKGQLLAVLENRDLTAAEVENKGNFEQAQAAYETTTAASLPEEVQKAQLEVKGTKLTWEAEEKVYHSREELFQEGALPRKEMDQAGVSLTQARSQYEIAQKHLDSLMAVGKRSELKSAAGQLQSAKGKYLGATAQLEYSEIHSPIDGVVTDRPMYAGEMAAGTPLITVMDTSQVIARAHIPEADAAKLMVGNKAGISAPGMDTPVEGKVTVVSPALDPNSTTVEIWVQAANPQHSLRPGTSVTLSMIAQTVKDAVVIPAPALLTAADGGTSVMVIGTDGRAHQKTVKAGIRQGDDVQITDGLQGGERVVASGAYGLPDNTKIRIEAASQPENEKSGGGKSGDDAKDAKPDEK